MEYGSIKFKSKTGAEEIVCPNIKRTLLNFWQWAYSDLIGNTERGQLAEYLVALACSIDKKDRISWGSYDLQLDNGIKIEVKSSGYLQTWKQKRLSKPIFNMPKTLAWDHIEGTLEKEKKRQADVYIFALHAHETQETINPLDTNQWEFYVLSTKVLDAKVGDAKQITLEKLIKLDAIKCSFEDIKSNILLAFTKNPR
jgi:hypothetical protein